MARLAADARVEGVVCAVKELGDVAQVTPDLIKVTPGIRPSGADTHDQARVATPGEAIRRGADWLVIGRAITRDRDPARAAEAIQREVAQAAAAL